MEARRRCWILWNWSCRGGCWECNCSSPSHPFKKKPALPRFLFLFLEFLGLGDKLGNGVWALLTLFHLGLCGVCIFTQSRAVLIVARCSDLPGLTYSCSRPPCRPGTCRVSVGRWTSLEALCCPQEPSGYFWESCFFWIVQSKRRAFSWNQRDWVKVMVLWLTDSLSLTGHWNLALWCTWTVVWGTLVVSLWAVDQKEGWKLSHRIYSLHLSWVRQINHREKNSND